MLRSFFSFFFFRNAEKKRGTFYFDFHDDNDRPLPAQTRELEIFYFFFAAFSSSFALVLFSLLPKLRASARAIRSSLNTFRDFSSSVIARSVKMLRPGVVSMGKTEATDLSCLAPAVTSAAESPFLTLPALRGKRINFDLYSVRRATLV